MILILRNIGIINGTTDIYSRLILLSPRYAMHAYSNPSERYDYDDIFDII